ncbi:uncharacterized protein LODBEIA_P21500 [Lodderomyces beijingensis]|uniref:DUF4484 domain-containing protein n=1 Tax=Lodderomyces beijingensis TaxID=1775926 RepID=A0ABP0ZLD1_9ASCO
MSHEVSKVVAVFLVEFDTKSGYKLQWSKSYSPLANFSLEGVEYKVLPSGVHETKEATVFISQKVGGDIYYGVSCFNQFQIREVAEDEAVDRENLRMYAAGVLCKPRASEWKPNEFINNGWEYIDDLKKILAELTIAVRQNNFTESTFNFDSFFKESDTFGKISPTLLQTTQDHQESRKSINNQNHLLLKMPQLLHVLGPLVFVVFKQSLLRKNILLFNELFLHAPHLGDDKQPRETTETKNKDQYALATSFSYLIAVLSVIPKDIKLANNPELRSQQPLYNVGLNELQSDVFESAGAQSGYIASTSDEILKSHNKVYDVGVEVGDSVRVFSNQASKDPFKPQQKKLKATIRDYHKFQKLYTQYISTKSATSTSHLNNDSTSNLNKTPSNNSSLTDMSPSEELAEFTTTTAPKPPRKTYTDLSPPSAQLSNEPSWWRSQAVEPVSWSESVWSAFSWFASAGQNLDSEDECTQSPKISKTQNAQNVQNVQNVPVESSLELSGILQLIGYFHKLTLSWFNHIDQVLMERQSEEEAHFESAEDRALVRQDSINLLHLSYQDMLEMDLDPYSWSDIEFLQEFVALYYGDKVGKCQIGYNLTNICC